VTDLLKRLTMAAGLALAVAGGASADDKITLSLATWGASSHPQVKVYTPIFMDEVTKRTNGRVEWKFFPDDTMVKQAFVPTAIPGGQVDISLTTLDSWAGRVPAVSIAASPLWTLTMDESAEQLQPGRPLFDHFDKLLGAQQTKLLALFDIGPPTLFTRFPIDGPQSLAGQTIRAYSKGAAETLQALGAAPVNMGVADVYSALQRGAIEGTLGGLQGAYGLKHYEVTSNMLGTGGIFGALVNGYVMNRRRFDRLPKDVQQAILDATAAARAKTVEGLISSYNDYVDRVKAAGLTTAVLKPGTPQWEAWEAALADYRKKIASQFDPETVALVAGK